GAEEAHPRTGRREDHPKKGYRSLDVGQQERFGLVKRLGRSHSVKTLCDVFDVHRSSYKYWVNRKAVVDVERARQKAMVRQVFRQSQQSAGARSIATALTNMGVPLSRYRASSMMTELQLVSTQLPSQRYKTAG